MANHQDKIELLQEKLELLLKQQEAFSKEVNTLQAEINQLRTAQTGIQKEEAKPADTPATKPDLMPQQKESTGKSSSISQKQPVSDWDFPPKRKKKKTDFEKFIGENLANKIGVIIMVIGVAIGAKYTIENELVGPLTRIIIGYLVGIGLMGFAIKLKNKYKNFSAVLLSGAMAIMYFITFAAYSFYDLVPLPLTFVLMVVFTAFTVLAAIRYDRPVIAHIGLVGAYAVPFLLSDGSGRVAFLFSYMAIINAGILILAIKKYWKSLYYAAFGLTWLIYLAWYIFEYQTSDHFGLALTFLILFFFIFYLTFLAYKLIQKEKFNAGDVVMVLANSLIFYGIGYTMLGGHDDLGVQLLGVFTLGNAVVHFIISLIVYRQRLADRNLFYLVSGLVLVFLTLTIPVQLDGNWVTLLWTCEAALLFWIGRTKQVSFYEKLSYPLMAIAFLSIVQDWKKAYDLSLAENTVTAITPLLNIHFLTSLLFIAAFGFIYSLQRHKNYASPWNAKSGIAEVLNYAVPGVLIFSIYYAFHLEIAVYWNQLYTNSALSMSPEGQDFTDIFINHDLLHFKTIWIINYTLLFVASLALMNFRKLKNQQLGWVNLILITLTMLFFLADGLYALSELRESYLDQTHLEYYHQGIFHIGIRYVSFIFVTLALLSAYRYTKQRFMQRNFNVAFDFTLHITLVWIASSELISWMDIAGWSQQYKLGLSILWGVYSLVLIALGIWRSKKYLRIAAIALFGLTLIKLFFYDISHLDTIARTIVFISLGGLLLIISFLYNKFKHIIADETSH